MATHFDWTAPIPLGSHHIARAFVRAGWDVAYVSEALSLPQLVRDSSDFMRRARAVSRGGKTLMGGHLWTYMPVAYVTPHNAPLLRSRAVHRHWQHSTVPPLVKTIRDHGFGQVDLLYVDVPTQAFWLRAIGHRASVARIADRYAGFVGVASELLALERDLISGVDLVVHSAKSLEPHVVANGARRHEYLPNGVDFERFATRAAQRPKEYEGVRNPIAVYAGTLDHRFDANLVTALARRMSDVEFFLIGPNALAGRPLETASNIHAIGSRPHPDLPAFLQHADVGLIPFDVAGHAQLVGGVHPLKLYEYLACGLPVVATRWPELESIGSPARLCDGIDQFEVEIRSVLNSDYDSNPGIALAREASWDRRVANLSSMVRATTGSSADGTR